MILETIKSISHIRSLSIDDLKILSRELRDFIIEVVSKTGGHLSSSLGVVDLTIALHYVFHTPKDKIIWDVGHQSYAHKILTGRRDKFRTLRQMDGISGFPKRSESEFDPYNTGHSSTSLSLALGDAVGRDLSGQKYKVIAVIGDGSLTGGMAFEALNQIGHLKNDVIIVLNDNEHSIDKNVGALSQYLTRIMTGSLYNRLRKRSYEKIKKIPKYGERIYDFMYKAEAGLKGILVPGHLFEELGIRYFGPINGHNMEEMITIFSRIKNINTGPRIVHVITKKGKGYAPAEKHPARFHGVGSFDPKSGTVSRNNTISFSEIAGRTLASIAKNDKKIIAITAAMKLGTGLSEFEKIAPRRFFDVGIAEQHAITFAAALASKGFKPFVSIYSTFLQRAIDQVIHDVALMNLPVRFLIDRAGIVGDDGETHHGLFDIALLRNIPNFIIMAPSNGVELRDMVHFAASYQDGPMVIRYPRGSVPADQIDFTRSNSIAPGRCKRIKPGSDCAIFAVGDMVDIAIELRTMLLTELITASVINLLSIKPLDVRMIQKYIEETRHFCIIENGSISGGVGEHILFSIKKIHRAKFLFAAGFPDELITHGKNPELLKKYSIDARSLFYRIVELLK